MDINKILSEYDDIEAKHDFKATEAFLLSNLEEAKASKEMMWLLPYIMS